MIKIYFLLILFFVLKSNNFSQTIFPLEVGTKWYYQGYHYVYVDDITQRKDSYFYGIIKEVTGIVNDSTKEITAKFIYKDSLITIKEYWAFKDGIFYYSSDWLPNYFTFPFHLYDEQRERDTCAITYLDITCVGIIDYQIFNFSGYAQSYSRSLFGRYTLNYFYIVTLPQVGIVVKMNKQSSTYTNTKVDSTYLIGMYTGGLFLGDTTFNITVDIVLPISLPLFPLNNATGISTNVELKWSKVPGSIFYEVQISTDSTFQNSVKNYNDLTDTSIFIDNLGEGSTYFWRVKTVRDENQNWSQIWKFTTVISHLLYPFNNATGISTNVELKWGRVPGSIFYEIQISTDSTFQSSVTHYNDLTDTSIFIDNLGEGSTYFWHVKTVRDENHFWSSVWKFTTISLPVDFVLYQNYPNPFNSRTKIKLDIPEPCFISLYVYDILGNKIETIIKEEKQAGSYKVEFDGSSLSSGIYYYNLKAGEYSEVKKMLLLK